MKLNFRKISALASSVLMLGMTAGIAAAATYPAPFVAGGSADVGIVYGSGAALSDSTAAGSIATSLSGFVSGGTVNVTGEAVALDRGTSSRIWLNTSLANAQSIFTKTDLPTVLATSSFSGDVSTTVTPQVTLMAPATAGGDNSNTAEFSKQPTSSTDPQVGVSMGVSAGTALYNASVIFGNAVNFSSANTQGQTLHLFGRDYVVSSDSSTTNGIVLFQSAQTLTLSQSGSGAASATVTVNGVSHTIQLVNAGTSSATISVDGTSQSVNTGSSRQINGVSIAVTSVQSSTAGGNTATVLVGSNKLTFKNGQFVTQGDSNTAILGTTAYITGTVNATTALTVAVFGADTTHDAIVMGNTFVDPVWGSFGLTNSGLSSDIADSSRDTLKVGTSGATTLTLSMKDKNGNSAVFDWATNKSTNWNLSTSNGYPIYPYEGANLSLNSYTLTGTGSSNQNVGRLLQLQTVYNDSSTATNDYVQFYDPISGSTLKTGTATTEGTAPLIIDGRQYTVTYQGTAGSATTATVQIKFPSESGASDVALFPTILASNGESVALYAPQTLNLTNVAGAVANVANFQLPNGNGYTAAATSFISGDANLGLWKVGSGAINTSAAAGTNSTTITAGRVVYNFSSSGSVNKTNVYVDYPTVGAQSGGAQIAEPALVVFDGKDSNNNYNAVIIDTTALPAGTSTNGVGVSGIYHTSTSGYGNATSGVQLASNSNLAQWMDGFGTLVTKDSTSSGQPIATLTYPSQQVFEQLFLGASSAVVSGGGALGNVLVTDSQVSSVSSHNLIVVGGSCINSAAAALVGGAYCGSAWTSATGIGAGQFLIKSYAGSGLTSKMALLVAGYEAADTTNAATYLRTQTVDTSKAYQGTSSTTANLIVQ